MLKLYLLLLTSLVINNIYGQEIKQIIDVESFNYELTKIIDKTCLIDTINNDFKVAFTIKIDSTGEVYSTHIRWSYNLKVEEYYKICDAIESKFNLLFLYEKFSKELNGEKFLRCTYPFFSSMRIQK